MRTFSEVLSEIVKESDLSIYGMAKAIDCDRTMLNKVISGDRNINLCMFMDIYTYLKRYIETYRLDELYEAFWERYLGNKEYNIVKYIKHKFKHMKREENEYEKIHKLALKDTDIYKYVKANDIRERAIIDRLYKIICKVISDNNNVKLYVHLPVYWKGVISFLKFVFNINEVREHIELVYIHTGYNGKYDSEFIQMANYMMACEFALNGISTYDKNNWCRIENETELAPYYIISEADSFFMSKELDIITIENSEYTYESIINTVNQIYNGNKRFNNIIAYEHYGKILINTIKNDGKCINIGNKLPVKLFCTKEIFNKVIKDERKDKEYLINIMELYYKNIRGDKCDVMVSDTAILNFMTDCSIDDMYFDVNNDDIDIKLEILNNIYNYYILNTNSLFTAYNNKKCNIPTELSIVVLSEQRICSLGYIDVNGKREKAISLIDSVAISKHFKNFYEYMTCSNICMEKQDMMKLLDGIISTYKRI